MTNEKSYFPEFCTMVCPTDFFNLANFREISLVNLNKNPKRFLKNSQENCLLARVRKGAVLDFESWHLFTLYHLSYGINIKSTQMQRNIMPKNDNSNAKIVCLLLPRDLY